MNVSLVDRTRLFCPACAWCVIVPLVDAKKVKRKHEEECPFSRFANSERGHAFDQRLPRHFYAQHTFRWLAERVRFASDKRYQEYFARPLGTDGTWTLCTDAWYAHHFQSKAECEAAIAKHSPNPEDYQAIEHGFEGQSAAERQEGK